MNLTLYARYVFVICAYIIGLFCLFVFTEGENMQTLVKRMLAGSNDSQFQAANMLIEHRFSRNDSSITQA